jgi:hypothetical protein
MPAPPLAPGGAAIVTGPVALTAGTIPASAFWAEPSCAAKAASGTPPDRRRDMCAPGGNFCPRNSGRIRGDRFARDRLGRLAARGACAATLPASCGPESCVRHGANVFSPCGRATMALSFSRCVRIRVLLKAAARKAILPLAGKRSADRRIQTESASAEEFAQTPQTLCRAARAALPARHGRWGTGPLASRRSTAALRQAAKLDSAPGRASWHHRIQTGGPSPAPVQRAPRSPVTRRTG